MVWQLLKSDGSQARRAETQLASDGGCQTKSVHLPDLLTAKAKASLSMPQRIERYFCQMIFGNVRLQADV